MTSNDLLIAAPELVLALSALVLLMLGALGGSKAAGAVSWLGVLALAGAAIVVSFVPLGSAFNGALQLDEAAVFSKVAIFVASAIAIPLGMDWLKKRGDVRFEYAILVILAALGMAMMVSAGDLIALYVGVELHSLALYVMAAFRRDDARSSEAGLKYFVLGALSSGLLLYGASLIYGFAGSMNFSEIAAATGEGAGTGALFGLVFLICGLAFKVSAAPFHMWTPDVYEGAPTPVVGFFAAAPKLAAMVLFARALQDGFPGAVDQWRQVLVVVSMASIAVGAFAGLAQKNLKRLWAYSSIANIGYAVLGLAAGGEAGIHAMLMFMVLYMIDVTGFFACLQALNRSGRPMETIDDMAGLAKEKPGLALAITVFSLSALGLPPLSGFWAKFYVFKAAIGAGLGPFAAIGLVGSVVAAFYYLRLLKSMWFDASAGSVDKPAALPRGVAITAALFGFPVVLVALSFIDPLAKVAAATFGSY